MSQTTAQIVNDMETQNQRDAEQWLSQIPTIAEPTENQKRNTLIGLYRKCRMVLSVQTNDRRVNRMFPYHRANTEAVNRRVEQMHTYRQGIRDLAPYVHCTADTTLMAAISAVLRA
jgi:hypothetical protein